MILVTGGTGFIGSALINHYLNLGEHTRILLRPSLKTPALPRGIFLEAAVSSLRDEQGLQAAMKGVDTIYHFASAERQGDASQYQQVDVEGTRAIIEAAHKARVNRFFFLSYIGADKNSIFPMYKAKALAEETIIQSRINYTIYRTSVIFGAKDHFISQIMRVLRFNPIIFLLPGNGEMKLQPLWIQDLISCLALSRHDDRTNQKIFTMGGGEFLSYKEIVRIVMKRTGRHRILVPFSPAYLRTLNLWLGRNERGFPYTNNWLDFLASDRTCALDTLPKLFGLLPARFEKKIDLLI